MIDGRGNEDGNQSRHMGNRSKRFVDLATYQWTNILSLDDNTITEYGTNAFDYESNVLYRILWSNGMYKLDLNNQWI